MSAKKDCRGNWSQSEDFTLGADGRTLRLSTFKSSNGSLCTTATVGVSEPGSFSYIMYQDFSKKMIVSRPSRITASAVEAQHMAARDQLNTLMVEVASHYPGVIFPRNLVSS